MDIAKKKDFLFYLCVAFTIALIFFLFVEYLRNIFSKYEIKIPLPKKEIKKEIKGLKSEIKEILNLKEIQKELEKRIKTEIWKSEKEKLQKK